MELVLNDTDVNLLQTCFFILYKYYIDLLLQDYYQQQTKNNRMKKLALTVCLFRNREKGEKGEWQFISLR